MAGGQIAEELIEGVDVVWPVVGRKCDAGEENFDMRCLERGDDLVEIVPGLVEGQAAEAVVATELNDDDGGMKTEQIGQAGDGVLGGGSAGSLVKNAIGVAVAGEDALQIGRVCLGGIEAVAGGDAVTIADEDGLVRSRQRAGEKQKSKRND